MKCHVLEKHQQLVFGQLFSSVFLIYLTRPLLLLLLMRFTQPKKNLICFWNPLVLFPLIYEPVCSVQHTILYRPLFWNVPHIKGHFLGNKNKQRKKYLHCTYKLNTFELLDIIIIIQMKSQHSLCWIFLSSTLQIQLKSINC